MRVDPCTCTAVSLPYIEVSLVCRVLALTRSKYADSNEDSALRLQRNRGNEDELPEFSCRLVHLNLRGEDAVCRAKNAGPAVRMLGWDLKALEVG